MPKASAAVDARQLEKLFKEVYERSPPQPTAAQCYHLANNINSVRLVFDKDNERWLRNLKDRRELRGAVNKIKQVGDRRNPGRLEALYRTLDDTADALIGPVDPREGKRANASLHKPMRFLANAVSESLRAAGHEHHAPSIDKRSPYVKTVQKVLILATGKEVPLATIASALKPPAV
jgi:hypothetical protein